MPDVIELCDLAEACAIIGGAGHPISRASFYNGIAAGRYPKPVKVGPNMSRWSKSDLQACIAAALKAR